MPLLHLASSACLPLLSPISDTILKCKAALESAGLLAPLVGHVSDADMQPCTY